MLVPYDSIDRLFDRVVRVPSSASGLFPALDIAAREDEILLTAEVPGFDASGIEIRIEEETLVLRGTREESKTDENATALLRERFRGTFSRSLALPYRVDATKIEARLKDGVLTVRLPRAEADRPKRIEIKVEA